jgi:hypothetical protein
VEIIMSSFAGTADGTAAIPCRRHGRLISRGWEITGIILGFVFAWPVAVAYLVWKFAGYPAPEAARAFVESRWGRGFGPAPGWTPGFRSTGNSAFEEYRRSELQRLEEERRRIDEESRAFAVFVEELKRAKDREEFDAFMAKRRAGGQSA